MPAFQYSALCAKGKIKKSFIEADSLKHARQLLREQGYTILEVKPAQKKRAAQNKTLFEKPSLGVKELALITRQFATLLQAGLPIEEVLSAVAEQTEKPKTKACILSVRSKVLEGHALASALREHPEAFSELYAATVAAGEKSGHLDIILQRLADYTEKQSDMRQKIQQALIYPSIMVIIAVGIVGFLLTFVVPKMISVYGTLGQELPGMTQGLIALSLATKRFGIYLIICLVFFIVILKRSMKRRPQFQKKIHAMLLRLPLIGNAIKVANTARFSRTFAILSSAGISVLEAMTIASTLITNLPIRKAIEEATLRIREGANIHLALKQTSYFPPMSIHLIASGESSGQLENMLERAANNQDGEITRLIETCLALFEPAIILAMGGIVLFIVLAILLPIFQLDQLTG